MQCRSHKCRPLAPLARAIAIPLVGALSAMACDSTTRLPAQVVTLPGPDASFGNQAALTIIEDAGSPERTSPATPVSSGSISLRNKKYGVGIFGRDVRFHVNDRSLPSAGGRWAISKAHAEALTEIALRVAREAAADDQSDLVRKTYRSQLDISILLPDHQRVTLRIHDMPVCDPEDGGPVVSSPLCDLESAVEDLTGIGQYLRCPAPCRTFPLPTDPDNPSPSAVSPVDDSGGRRSFVSLQRTGWYQVEVDPNGDVKFWGTGRVRVRTAQWTIPKSKVDTLFTMASRARGAWRPIHVHKDGTTVDVISYAGPPNFHFDFRASSPTCSAADADDLCKLEQAIDDLTGTAAYARCGESGLPACAPPEPLHRR